MMSTRKAFSLERHLLILEIQSQQAWIIARRYNERDLAEMVDKWVAHDNLHTRQLVELRRSRLLNLTATYDVHYGGEW